MSKLNLLTEIAEVSAKYRTYTKLGTKLKINVFQLKEDKSVTFKTLEEAVEKGLDVKFSDVKQVEVTTSPIAELLDVLNIKAATVEDVKAAKDFYEMLQQLTNDSMFKRANNTKNAELSEAKTAGKSKTEIDKIRLERVQLYIKHGKKPSRLGADDMALYNAELDKLKNS